MSRASMDRESELGQENVALRSQRSRLLLEVEALEATIAELRGVLSGIFTATDPTARMRTHAGYVEVVADIRRSIRAARESVE